MSGIGADTSEKTAHCLINHVVIKTKCHSFKCELLSMALHFVFGYGMGEFLDVGILIDLARGTGIQLLSAQLHNL